jgi:hypothetical protein
MMNILEANRKRWEKQESVEQAEETQTELSDAEPDVSDDEEATKQSSETPSIMDFIPPPPRYFIPAKLISCFIFKFSEKLEDNH